MANTGYLATDETQMKHGFFEGGRMKRQATSSLSGKSICAICAICGKNSVNHGSGAQANSICLPRQRNLTARAWSAWFSKINLARCAVRQAVFDQREIQILVAAVKFVADDGMAEVREVDADLMLAAGARDDARAGKIQW